MFYILMYLGAVVAANVLASTFGPPVVIPCAFVLIGFTITARDALHDRFGDPVAPKMAALIATGAARSYALGSPQIAIASAVAFAVSEAVDTMIYHGLRRRRWMVRSNASNAGASVVDSIIFPTLAFGAFMPGIIAGQIAAKFIGGWLWSMVLKNRKAPAIYVVAVLLFIAPPADAQIANLGVGAVITEHGETPTLELFAASPPIVKFRLSAVVAVDDNGTFTYIAKGGVAVTKWADFEIGATALKFRGYEPEPFVGVFLRWKRFGLAVSAEPQSDWGWAVVAKINFWQWFKS